jgi:DNA invertase Pin-like site-specific DNA recombinase
MNCSKTRQQIADEYGIHRVTLNRWLRRYNIILPSGLITPLNQVLIYQKLGHPK